LDVSITFAAMKTILITLFISLSYIANAQEWKERYITETGDTLTLNSKVKLDTLKVSYNYVLPSKYYPTSDPLKRQPLSVDQYRANAMYLNVYMKGKTYAIERFTRIPAKDGYKHFAIFMETSVPMMGNLCSFQFVVDIDNAIKNKEVEFLK